MDKLKVNRRTGIPLLIFAVTLLIAILVLLGWAFDIPTLKSVLPHYITMKANTALCFAMLALIYAFESRRPRKGVFIAVGLCFVVILINLTTLAEYIYDVDLKLDQFLFNDPDGIGGRFPPGRLAPITAVNFILLAVSFLSGLPKSKRFNLFGQILAAIVWFASFQAIVGYAIGVTYLFGSAFYTQMAIHTGLSFLLLATGQLLLNRSFGIMRSFSASTSTARLTRSMFIMAALVPPFMRWLAQSGLKSGHYDQDFAQLIQVVGITAVMAIIIGVIGAAMYRSDDERALQQVQLKKSEEKFKNLANSIPQMTWMTDASGYIYWYNKRWFDYTGTDINQMKGWGWQSVHHVDHVDRVTEKFNAHVRSGTDWEDTFPIKSASGEWRWFLSRAVVNRDELGHVVGWFGTNTDITENLESAKLLNEAREVAENASLAKSQFLANMSHEIRTPVGAIIGFTDLMKNPVIPQSEKESYVDIISRNSKNLLSLIDDILDLSKVESGMIALENRSVWLTNLLAEVSSTMQMKAREKGISFVVKFEGLVPDQISTDSVRLRQILNNLVGNAIKFTDRGQVTLSVRYIDPYLKMTIEDSGIGIAPNQIERLFKPFGQADASTTRKYGGTGLGLILSKRLSQVMGGDLILASSEEGKGSIFEATIQTTLPTDSTLSEVGTVAFRSLSDNQPVKPAAVLKELRVLLVEDSPDNQILIKIYLEKSGAVVDIADNGLLGVEKALAAPPDVVLMDVQMAVMDGHEATRRLRAAGFSKPIIALTAHAMKEDREKSFEAGCTDYLTKPINKTTLIETLTAFVRSR